MSISIFELARMNVPDRHGLFPKKNMAKCAWHALRGCLSLWTPEVANAKPYGPLNEIKYFIQRLPYTTKLVNMHWSQAVIENYGYVSKKISGVVTQDHYIGSYAIGEHALDNPDIYLVDGTLDTFTEELYPYTFLANYVTQDENIGLRDLKGKCLTDDKYEFLNIKLYDEYGNESENPKMPMDFTVWEASKYSGTIISRQANLSEYMC